MRRMKKLTAILLSGLILAACQDSETISDFTGNEITYSLQPGSDYAVSGTVVIKEKKNGTAEVTINLIGTDGESKLPVHLHLGDIAEADADVAALLSPVDATTGKSITELNQLADETAVTYAELLKLEACLKIHLSETGPGRDVILAAGNIGESFTKANQSGRQSVGLCKSE